ncbi:MAG TPA: TetR/AcrR family transcriptional regulator [Acidimicrobiales bacterium]|nr:TetR/AcrR family transcriptional regulator [Acidimicrobiales bacterium]
MVAEPKRNRQAERREATRGEILDAAWEVARELGLAGLSLRDVAGRIGMRPPSLYWYFDSKHAIYDAMFAQGNQALLRRIDERDLPTEPRARLREVARVFIEFAMEDPARSQLMFQRTIPDFEPSAESYAYALEVFERGRQALADAGVTTPEQLDLWTALVAGLTSQQLTNDPNGDRWLRLADDAIDMYADHVLPRRANRRKT